MKYFYHGSIISGIAELEVCSKLHNTQEKVVYLTDSIPYALYYIWDSKHNGYRGKHVTGWVKDGIAYYEEQFPEQLKTFYQGVSGYLYCVSDNSNIKAVENREHLFFCSANVTVTKAEQIADVYEELLKYEAEGKCIVLRYNEQSTERQNELIDLIANAMIHNNFYADDQEHKDFMKKYFSLAWERAEKHDKF